MICHQATLSGDAEWPKVADAVIEAEKSDISFRFEIFPEAYRGSKFYQY
jgi:hypothetical protein